MGVADEMREHVERAIDRLRMEYGAFPVIEHERTTTPAEYETAIKHFETHRTLGGAGVWCTNDADEVLLVRPEDENGWTVPGGGQEPGETYEDCARRELHEEAGIECELTGLTHVCVVAFDDGTDRRPVIDVVVTFEGEYLTGEPRPDPGEIAEARWWTSLPKNLLYEKLIPPDRP